MIKNIRNVSRPSVLKKIAFTSSLILVAIAIFVNISSAVIRRTVENEFISIGGSLLELYSRGLDNRISILEDYSLAMMTLADFQDPLKGIAGIAETHSQLYASILLGTALRSNVTDIAEVNSLLISDMNRHVYSRDSARFRLPVVEETQDKILARQGSPVWLPWPSYSNEIALWRAIRTVRNDFQHLDLGTIILVIDLDGFMDARSILGNFYASTLTVKDQSGNIIYTHGNPSANQQTQDIVLQKPVVGAGWTLYLSIPQETIFSSLNTINTTQRILFLVAFVLAITLSIVFAYRITAPLKRLSQAMEKVSHASFDFDAEELLKGAGNDEIGQLCKNFYFTTRQLETLINDIYKSEILKKDAQLKALQAQINPHFMYNALDSINWLAKLNSQEEIAHITQALARLLRNAMATKHTHSTLEKELSLVQDYIQIQRLRFGKRLVYIEDIDTDLLDSPLPKLILQPIIENAIKHCVEVMTTPCKVVLSAKAVDGHMKITIADNGPGIPSLPVGRVYLDQLPTRGDGIGMANVAQRLAIFYSGNCTLEIENMAPKGFMVHFIMREGS